jgi:hypothetical protein
MNPSDMLHEIHACEVCGGTNLRPVLDLGPHPMCDDLVAIGDPRICKEYPIEILFCETCCTGHQRFQIPKRALFPSSYHYRSRFTADVLTGMRELVAAAEARRGVLKGALVLDVGCNDGSLLNFCRERGSATIGIEPTSAASDARGQGHEVFEEFLSERLARKIHSERGAPDLITFTNVFAHIENLAEIVGALRILLKEDTLLIIENHYLGAVLDRNQFDTFYHEHPRTYSCTSFGFIAKALGVGPPSIEFPSRYGGNIRVYLGGKTEGFELDGHIAAREQRFFQQFVTLKGNLARWRKRKGDTLRKMVREGGRLRAKAFPGRAAILVKLLGLDESHIEAVHEKPGSMKIGHYVPGTRIPIHSDRALMALPDLTKPLLNLAWHIPTEIKRYMTELGYKGPIIDVLSEEDFAPP